MNDSKEKNWFRALNNLHKNHFYYNHFNDKNFYVFGFAFDLKKIFKIVMTLIEMRLEMAFIAKMIITIISSIKTE